MQIMMLIMKYRAFHETVIITRDRNHINKSSTDLAEICCVVQAHAWDSTHQSSDTPYKNQKSCAWLKNTLFSTRQNLASDFSWDDNHINKSLSNLAEICCVVQAHAWDGTHQSSDTQGQVKTSIQYVNVGYVVRAQKKSHESPSIAGRSKSSPPGRELIKIHWSRVILTKWKMQFYIFC